MEAIPSLDRKPGAAEGPGSLSCNELLLRELSQSPMRIPLNFSRGSSKMTESTLTKLYFFSVQTADQKVHFCGAGYWEDEYGELSDPTSLRTAYEKKGLRMEFSEKALGLIPKAKTNQPTNQPTNQTNKKPSENKKSFIS